MPVTRAAAMGAGIAIGATLEVLLAVWLTRRAVKTLQPLETPAAFLRFILSAAALAPAINAVFGVISLSAGGAIPHGKQLTVCLSWYLGDVSGILLAAPLLLAWSHSADLPLTRKGLLELVVNASLLGIVMQVLFGGAFPELSRSLMFLIVPFLAWIAFRFTLREVAAAVFLLCGVVVLATVRGLGPLAEPDPARSHLLLQSFICVTGGTSLFMASVVYQHRRAVEGLRRYAEQLHVSRQQLLRNSAELRKARDEAGRASQMKSEFLATVSHEFRTPLNAVIGMTDLLFDSPLTADQREYVRTVQASGRTLLALVNDILDMSRIEAGRLSIDRVQFSMREVVFEVAAVLAPTARARGLEFAVHFPEDRVPDVFGDPFRIRQVLMNLGSNAVKFTESGKVDFLVEFQTAGEAATRALVRVLDTGIGIPKDKQAILFEKFIQADASVTRRYGGTGLGLAISKRLVELMGGEIGFESEPGKGSEFWFALPLETVPPQTAREAAVVSVPSPEPASKGGSQVRVLVAEDNAVNQRVATHLLTKLGCSVTLARNGSEAVCMAREGGYKAVFMDCQMPEMDGYTATGEIRKLGPEGSVPIIAMTAGAMEGDRERCLAAGMDDYVSKPLELKALQEVLERWTA